MHPHTSLTTLWRLKLWLYSCSVGTIHSGLFYNNNGEWRTIICSVVADSAERQRMIVADELLRSVRHEKKVERVPHFSSTTLNF